MKRDHNKFVHSLFCLIGVIFSTSVSSQSINMTLSLTSPGCNSQYKFSDMQIQNGSSQLPVSSTGAVSFPSYAANLPVGAASMTSAYCNNTCSPCGSTSCPYGPYGNNFADCFSKCSQQIFITGNPLIQNGGTIQIVCNPPPQKTEQKNKVSSKKK